MKNILLLNAGTRNVLVRDFKKSLNGRAKVIATDNFELAPALYEADSYFVTRRWTQDGYWDEVENIIKNNDVGLVVSLIDPELAPLAYNKDKFRELGVLVNTSSPEVISDCFDKYQTLSFIKNNGFPWIRSYIDIDSIKKDLADGKLSFPLFAKPREGSGSAGIEKVFNLDRLETIFTEQTDLLVQEFVPSQEIGVDLYIDLISGEPVSIFAKKKLKMRAGETDKSVSFKNDKLFSTVLEFAKAFGLRGANDIDVFEINGDYYISEVNPRFGGGYIHAYAAGVDFPSLLINNMNGIINKPDIGNYREKNYMMKYFDIKVLDEGDIYG